MSPNHARDGPLPRFNCGIAALALILLVGVVLAGIYFLNESGGFAPGVYQETFYLRYDAPSLPNMFLANYGYEDGNALHFIGNFQAYVLISLLLLLLYLAIGPLLGIPGPFARCFFFWSLVTMMTVGALLITGFSLWVHSGDVAYGVGFSGINHELMGFFVFTILIGGEYVVGRRRWSRRHPLFFTWVAMIAGMAVFLAWVEFSIRMDIADFGGINAAHLAGSILGFTLPSLVFLVMAWKGSMRDTGGGPVQEESQEKTIRSDASDASDGSGAPFRRFSGDATKRH